MIRSRKTSEAVKCSLIGMLLCCVACGGYDPPTAGGSSAPQTVHPAWITETLGLDVSREMISVLPHDAQQIIDHRTNEYGAFYTAAAIGRPETDIQDGDTVHVATVMVSGGDPDPNAYFKDGSTCVWIGRAGSAYTAFLKPREEGLQCSRETPADTTLPVAVTGYGDAGEGYPAMVRWQTFEEAPGLALGVACGDSWCTVGISDPMLSKLRGGGSAPISGEAVKRRAPGWYDHQYLAMVNDAGELNPSPLSAGVIPASNLADLAVKDFHEEWRRVATIELDPGDEEVQKPGLIQYSGAWGMFWFRGLIGSHFPRSVHSGGHIEVEVRMDSVQKVDKKEQAWSGRYRQRWPRGWGIPYATSSPVIVIFGDTVDASSSDNSPRGSSPPGTARWGWHDDDESVWVRCGSGCCELAFRFDPNP